MSANWRIYCDDAELAVECARACAALAIALEPVFAPDAAAEAEAALRRGQRAGLALVAAPSPAALTTLAAAGRDAGVPAPIAVVAPEAERARILPIAHDLGLVAVPDVGALASAVALIDAGAVTPWTASTRALSTVDRVRLGEDSVTAGRGGGRFGKADDGLLSWSAKAGDPAVIVGAPSDLGPALIALRARTSATPPARAVIEGVDRAAVHDVIFGPPRALSDPASKAALEPYGLPLPLEELCTSPSRAASEASRLGFPVRISLTSPDLRIWDHPDLAVDGVDNAARVRDVYRQILAMATERQPDARLLGVHVTATTTALASLRVVTEPLPQGYVLAEIGFADPHGRAADDRTFTVLPAAPDAIERVLGRLRGRALLLGGPPAQRRAAVGAIADVLLRLAAFVDDHREVIDRVELHPLALLVGGAVEVREACVHVNDAFLRSLDSPRALGERT